MKVLRYWKILLAFVLTFVAGGVAGVVWTHVEIQRAFARGISVESFTGHVMNELEKKLKLTSEQKPQIRVVVEDMGREFKAAFGKAINESGNIMVRGTQRIDLELTPEQRIIHQQMYQEFRDGLKAKLNLDLPAQ